MGQLLHGSARTTAAVRRAIQHSQESLATLAERYHLNPKTVAKWKKRTHARCPDGTQDSALNRIDAGGRSADGDVPQTHAACPG
jgi:hypothetical protein